MATDMLLWDVTFRFATITILLLTAALSLRDARHLLQGRLAAALCICLASMLANTLPEALDPPVAWRAIAWVVHIPNIGLLWLFGLSLMVDDFRLKPRHWAVLGAQFVMLSALQYGLMTENDLLVFWFVMINRLIGLSVLAHLFWVSIRDYRDDLVEGRRSTRLWFMLASSIAALVIVGGETLQYFISGAAPDPEWFKIARVLIIFPITVFSAHWFLRVVPEQFLFEPVRPSVVPEPEIAPKDHATHMRLVAAMEDDKYYREQGLGIGELAGKLNVPEHQLRALINKGLGYRNFASFLNKYRLADAKAALADPEQARTPILTIAMDVGYASLATFNRAFKSEEGMTPSTFRSDALEAAVQS
ncbi:MAG: helix-turn-helix domain-containing protein [Pseudomonadota bacterium]